MSTSPEVSEVGKKDAPTFHIKKNIDNVSLCLNAVVCAIVLSVNCSAREFAKNVLFRE